MMQLGEVTGVQGLDGKTGSQKPCSQKPCSRQGLGTLQGAGRRMHHSGQGLDEPAFVVFLTSGEHVGVWALSMG